MFSIPKTSVLFVLCTVHFSFKASGGTNLAQSCVLGKGWGVDALLSCAIPQGMEADFLNLVKSQSEISILRERGTGSNDPDWMAKVIKSYEEINRHRFSLLAFAQDIRDRPTVWGPWSEDLTIVYNEGIRIGRDYAALVSAWELHNEPELGWWPDMPDRYAAHAKALYLGLKAGARAAGKDTPVLLGALGLPPGPWLERSARNGLLAYADAWNVHYYGDASQFTGFLDSHVQAMRDLLKPEGGDLRPERGNLKPGGMAERRWPVKSSSASGLKFHVSDFTGAPRAPVLPIWATEVGVNTVTPDTWADPVRRQRQADWIVSTARQARAHPHMAVFMPFVLVHKDDGYALTESATKPWPAWDAYARYTRENPFPARPAIRPQVSGLRSPAPGLNPQRSSSPQISGFRSKIPGFRSPASSSPQVSGLRFQVSPLSPNPVVLQWLADAETASGHKLAAAYRWRADGRPIRGELRIYNFGDREISGRLVQTREPGDGGFNSSDCRFQVSAAPPSAAPPSDPLIVPPGGMISISLSFSLEDASGDGLREWRQFSFVEESGRRSELGFALERSPDLYPPQAAPLPVVEWTRGSPRFDHVPHAVPSDRKGAWQAINGVGVLFAKGALARFQLGARPFDSEYPSMAAASLPKGLPEHGWLRVAMRELGPVGARVRVDLVDKDGRRFTQWENLGQARGLPASAPRWLNLVDFHPYAWGRLDERRRLRPKDVREIQLRFFASQGPTLVDVELGVATAYGTNLDPAGEVRLNASPDAKTAPVE